jgi:hypothetical protein
VMLFKSKCSYKFLLFSFHFCFKRENQEVFLKEKPRYLLE